MSNRTIQVTIPLYERAATREFKEILDVWRQPNSILCTYYLSGAEYNDLAYEHLYNLLITHFIGIGQKVTISTPTWVGDRGRGFWSGVIWFQR